MGRSGFRQALAVTFTIWLVFVYGSYCLSELIAGRTAFLRELPVDLVAVALVALTAQGLYPLARDTAGWPLVSRGALIAGAVVLVALVQSVISLVENRVLGVIPALDRAHLDLIRARFGPNFLTHLYLSLANAALLVFLVEARRSADQRIALARAEAATAEAQTVALRLQLNPHFLFNTLNSISSLIVTRRVDDAEEMIERLADFLRQSLQTDADGLVRLEDEFAMVETYLDIEAVRFGDRMLVELDCPPSLAAVTVPNYILQPLAENAVKYGVARSTRPVCIRMSARAEGGDLILCIEDDAVPDRDAPRPPGLGVGIQNVGQRLALYYGDRAWITPVQNGSGFSATLIVPMTTSSR